jgi:VanZ family protein
MVQSIMDITRLRMEKIKNKKGHVYMKKKGVVVVMLLGWALIIFLFSSQPYKQQDLAPILSRLLEGRHSFGILDRISFIFDGREVSVAGLGVIHFAEFFIRKGVHFFIFAVLGFLMLRVCHLFVKNNLRAFAIALFSVVFYACLDELHQYYTDGRSALWQDVVIDSVGGFFGISVSYWLVRRKRRT